jgi:hypothetical protein
VARTQGIEGVKESLPDAFRREFVGFGTGGEKQAHEFTRELALLTVDDRCKKPSIHRQALAGNKTRGVRRQQRQLKRMRLIYGF